LKDKTRMMIFFAEALVFIQNRLFALTHTNSLVKHIFSISSRPL